MNKYKYKSYAKSVGGWNIYLAMFRFVIQNSISRYKISKSNGGKCYKWEIGPFKETPILPGREDGCTEHYVAKNKGKNRQNGNLLKKWRFFKIAELTTSCCF